MPYRWERPCLTTDGTPELVAALATWAAVAAVTDCGVSASPQLSVEVVPPSYFTDGQSIGVAECYAGGAYFSRCVIKVIPAYQHDSRVILHETGHSLGLGHSADRDAVMWPVVGATVLSGDDRAAIVSLYGKRAPMRERRVVSVARD